MKNNNGRFGFCAVMIAAASLLGGCDATSEGDDGELRQVEQQIQAASEAETFLIEGLEDCESDYGACILDNLDDPSACDEILDGCIGDVPGLEDLPDTPDLPDSPDLPDLPDLPEISVDGFGDACVDELWTCIDGGGDPIGCSDDAQLCITDALGGVCDEAYDACIDAGAGAAACDAIVASCVLP